MLHSSEDYIGIVETCTHVMKKEYGSFNLLKDIHSSWMTNVEANEIIIIRRICTDDLYPYDAGTFLTWWHVSPTDPVTREDLSYIQSYVELKQELLMCLPNMLLNQITLEFKLNLLDKYIMNVLCGKTIVNMDKNDSILFKNFLDPSTWKKGKYLFNKNMEESVEYMKSQQEGYWMMRKSSKHKAKNIMRNSECVSFTYQNSNKQIKHVRTLHVIGNGWFWANKSSDHMKSFAEFAMNRKSFEPTFVSFVEILECFVEKHQLDWKKIIKSSK